MQSSNGQLLPQPDRPKPRVHNAKRCPLAIQQRIVNALANGDSIRAIAHALHVSNNTVVAIRDQEWQQVAARKARIAAQSELIATEAADRTLEAIRNREIKGQGLIPAFGVAVDKLIALRGDPSLTIRHEHLLHTITKDTLLAYAVAQSKTVQAKVVSAPALANAMPVPGSGPAGSGPAMHQNGKGRQSKKKVV
jgi:hypothetical protein